MSIPRYRDEHTGELCEIYLYCPKCGWAITKDRITEAWTQCRLCQGELITISVNYPSGEVVIKGKNGKWVKREPSQKEIEAEKRSFRECYDIVEDLIKGCEETEERRKGGKWK